MKIFECSGTPREIGRQTGEALREEIRENYARDLPHTRHPAWGQRLSVFVHTLEQHLPSVLDEMCGMAEGANASLEQVFANNFPLFSHDLHLEGCTNIAIAGGPDGPLWGKNNDGLADVPSKQFCARVIRPRDGIPMVMFTACGIVAIVDAMNAEGVAVGHSSVGSVFQQRDDYLDIRHWGYHNLQRSRTAEEFVRGMSERPLRGKGYSFVCVDRFGALCSLEAPCPLLQVRKPDNPHFVTCVNAYLLPTLAQADQRTPAWKANALARHAWLKNELSREEPVDLARLQAILRHHGSPSICKHGEEDGGTCEHSMIGLPTQGRALVCLKHPCRNSYQEIRL